MWFKLKAQGLELYLGVERLDEVNIHEEIIPELLEELVRDIGSSGEVKDPVITDPSTGVVLDGMHRVAALRELGCRYLPVCLVDYRSPKVGIGCWYRVIWGKVGKKFINILKLLGLEVESTTSEDARLALERRNASTALLTRGACYLLRGPKTDIDESYAWVKRIERALLEEGFRVNYECESDAERKVRSGEAAAVLMVPAVRKEEVVEAALSGNVFAHKTTRHIMPARPVNVKVPLEWLTRDKSLEEVDHLLVESLSKRKLKRLPKGSIFNGRRYDEELLVFE